MKLKEFSLSFIAEQDRLLLVLKTDQDPLSIWLTRRSVLMLLPMLDKELTKSNLPCNDTAASGSGKRMLSHERDLAATKNPPKVGNPPEDIDTLKKSDGGIGVVKKMAIRPHESKKDVHEIVLIDTLDKSIRFSLGRTSLLNLQALLIQQITRSSWV